MHTFKHQESDSTVFHHGDWSGEVQIHIEGDDLYAEMPMSLILAMAAEWKRHQMLMQIEGDTSEGILTSTYPKLLL